MHVQKPILFNYFCAMLMLPPTIHIPTADELWHRADAAEILAKRNEANITQGFIIRPNKTKQLPFNFLAEININNNKLWHLFITLAANIPAEVCCTFGLNDGEDESNTSPYIGKATALQILSKYTTELVMDASLEFGLLYQTKEALTEIVVTPTKYIKFWGEDKQQFVKQVTAFNLHEIHDLAFIDEYPTTILPSKSFVPNAKRPEEVVRALKRDFGMNG